MNDRAIELFTQAVETAYKLCEEHGHDVNETDHIWVSIMAGTLTELIVKECAEIALNTEVEYNEIDAMHRIRDSIKEHFGITP